MSDVSNSIDEEPADARASQLFIDEQILKINVRMLIPRRIRPRIVGQPKNLALAPSAAPG